MNVVNTAPIVAHMNPPATPPTRAERNLTSVFGMNMYKKVKTAEIST
jgi:hypothetical protein